jgi:hypothetical protein
MCPNKQRRARGHPSGQHCNSSFVSLFALPPCVYKRDNRATVTRADESNTRTKGLGSTPSPDQFVTPTTNNPSTGTRQLELDVGYYFSEAWTSINLVVSCANHPSPQTIDTNSLSGGREPRHQPTKIILWKPHQTLQKKYFHSNHLSDSFMK